VFACVLGSTGVATASGHGAPAHAEEAAADTADYSGLKVRGIDLGHFRIRSYYPVDAQKSTVAFDLHVAVASENYAIMQRLAKHHEHKLRDQVITATRMSPLAIFDEPGLENFRRRIYVRLRRALPQLVIADVYVSEFQLTVKSL
jgi:hypothetical protein